MSILLLKSQTRKIKNGISGWGERVFFHLSEVFTVVIYSLPYQSMCPPLVCHRYWDKWSSEPNNHQSGGEHGEDCATLDSHAKTWFDVPCEHIYKRVCQMDAIQLNWITILQICITGRSGTRLGLIQPKRVTVNTEVMAVRLQKT